MGGQGPLAAVPGFFVVTLVEYTGRGIWERWVDWWEVWRFDAWDDVVRYWRQ